MKRMLLLCLIVPALISTSGCATRLYTDALTEPTRKERITAINHAVDLEDRIAIEYVLTTEAYRVRGKKDKTVHSGSLRYAQRLADLKCDFQPLNKDMDKLKTEGTPVKILYYSYVENKRGLAGTKTLFRKTDLPVAIYHKSDSFYVVRRAPDDQDKLLGTACENIARGYFTPTWQVVAGAPLYPAFIVLDVVTAPIQLLYYGAMSQMWWS